MEVSFQIDSAAISDRGLSQKRPQNEDSFLEINQKGIFAVADGVGGAQAGEVASQMAVEILGEAFTNLRTGADAERVMRNALEQANSAIHQMSNDLAQLSKMATTVVALHIEGNIATIGHVGDSRLYRLDSFGTMHRETEDHSMVAEEVRAGRMTEEQAENHPSKNIISRALGAERSVQVDLKTMMVGRDCTFLLCSDGVTRHISDSELAELLSLPDQLDRICLRIKEVCFERGAEDNLTAVLVRLSGKTLDSLPIGGDKSEILSIDNREDFLTVPDFDEVTVATSRGVSSPTSSDDDDFLELETAELKIPEFIPEVSAETIQIVEEGPESVNDDDLSMHETIPAPTYFAPQMSDESDTEETQPDLVQIFEETPTEEEVVAVEPDPVKSEPIVPAITNVQPAFEPAIRENYSPFSGSILEVEKNPSTIRNSNGIIRFFSYLGLLLFGAGIGLGVYHFALKPAEQGSVLPITEMRSGNIPLSAFEDNRRLVDSDPSSYLAKAPAPDDAENFYLQGRAYMLTGDFIKARAAFVEARNRFGNADQVNAKVIASDIAVAMAITNDPTAQKNFKAELEAGKSGPLSNTNVNR